MRSIKTYEFWVDTLIKIWYLVLTPNKKHLAPKELPTTFPMGEKSAYFILSKDI